MGHAPTSKALCAALASALVVILAVTGCSSSRVPTSGSERRLGSHGVTAVVPAGWHRVHVTQLPGAIIPLQVASFPVNGAMQTICDPRTIVRQIPAGGAVLQILQDGGPSSLSDYKPLAEPFRLGPLLRHECGEGYNIFFRKGGSVFQLRVWTTPEGPNRAVRHGIETLMEGLRVRP